MFGPLIYKLMGSELMVMQSSRVSWSRVPAYFEEPNQGEALLTDPLHRLWLLLSWPWLEWCPYWKFTKQLYLIPLSHSLNILYLTFWTSTISPPLLPLSHVLDLHYLTFWTCTISPAVLYYRLFSTSTTYCSTVPVTQWPTISLWASFSSVFVPIDPLLVAWSCLDKKVLNKFWIKQLYTHWYIGEICGSQQS